MWITLQDGTLLNSENLLCIEKVNGGTAVAFRTLDGENIPYTEYYSTTEKCDERFQELSDHLDAYGFETV